MPKRSSASVTIFYPPHDRFQLVKILRKRIEGLASLLPLRKVVLFGSWARGKATAFSDIDLLVIYADPPRPEAYQIVWRHLDLRGVEPHVYSEGEAERLNALLERMTRDGIVLFS
ncbi:MAG: nucleotidyltransferase domain-containing protein [Acidobacteriota bacterium]